MSLKVSQILTILCISLSPLLCQAKPYKIVVIDSGFNKTTASKVKLCSEGHKDLTGMGEFNDVIGHGTHVSNVIGDNFRNSDYCFVIVKYTHDPKYEKAWSFSRTVQAFEYVKTLKDVAVVNFSSGGYGASKTELLVIKDLLSSGVKVFVAAGNNHDDLNKTCDYFPACYKLPGMNVVGNLNGLKKNRYSNYGNKVVTDWEQGTDIMAEVSERIYMSFSGTSQATAIATAKWVKNQ